jgi:hypothetical protein
MVGASVSRLLLLLWACTQPPAPPQPPGPLGHATAVVAADMDGDGRDDLVTVSAGRASWPGHNLALEGKVSAFTRGDVGQDGKEDVLLATGAGKGFPAATTRLWRLGADGPELLWEADRARQRITDIRVEQGAIFIALFSGGKTLSGAWVESGTLRRVTRTQMGLQQIPLTGGQVAVGRLYGDAPRSEGDLRILSPDAEDRVLPTLRGVRALGAADLDGDGALDLLAADGWHFKYGTHGRARVVVFMGPSFKDRRVLAEFPDEYTINRIEVLARAEGGPRILLTGTQQVHLLQQDAMGWQSRAIAPVTELDRAVLWSDQGHQFAIVSGSPAKAIALDG